MDPSESKGQRKEDIIIMLGWSHSQPLRIRKPDLWFGRECGGELNYPVGPPHDPDGPSRSLSGVQTTSYMLLYPLVWGFDLGHEQLSPAHLGDGFNNMRRLLDLSSLHSLLEKCLAFGCPVHG